MADYFSKRKAIARKAITVMSGYTAKEIRILGVLVDTINSQTGRLDPSIERIAALVGCDRATVYRALSKFGAGPMPLVVRSSGKRKRQRNSYELVWDNFKAIADEYDRRARLPWGTPLEKLRPPESQDCDSKGRTDATQTPFREPNNNNNVENGHPHAEQAEAIAPSGLQERRRRNGDASPSAANTTRNEQTDKEAQERAEHRRTAYRINKLNTAEKREAAWCREMGEAPPPKRKR